VRIDGRRLEGGKVFWANGLVDDSVGFLALLWPAALEWCFFPFRWLL